MNAVSLISGKNYEGPSRFEPDREEAEKEYEETVTWNVEEKEIVEQPKQVLKEHKPLPPFPSRLKITKRKWKDKEIMEIFHKEVNLPL